MKLIWTFCLIFLLVFCIGNDNAKAGELNQRLQKFPQWEKLTSVKPATGDLIYPQWMKGEWEVKSTLIDLVAPLAPDIITPGFESNRQFLNQPVSFKVRFIDEYQSSENLTPSYRKPLSLKSRGEGGEVAFKQAGQKLLDLTRINYEESIKERKLNGSNEQKSTSIIADRAYNGLNLARAILGNDTVKAVKVDPDSPNRQITFLRGERQLVSIVKSRATETTADGSFIATEVFQQLFKGSSRPYLNSVESTTAYRKLTTSNPAIEANQVTAVYLSSQDPNYFKAANKPVALYRYSLDFFPISKK